MVYQFIRQTGALREGSSVHTDEPSALPLPTKEPLSSRVSLTTMAKPTDALRLLEPEWAFSCKVAPVGYDGEYLTLASSEPNNLILADRLRALTGKGIRLVQASETEIIEAIIRWYGQPVRRFQTAFDEDMAISEPSLSEFSTSTLLGFSGQVRGSVPYRSRSASKSFSQESKGMFYFTIHEGERFLMKEPTGAVKVLVGPQRIWQGRRTFEHMRQHLAHPGQFLIVKFRDGRQQHLAGSAELWFDPRIHSTVTVEDALQIAAKEAVVVYTRSESPPHQTTRRIVHGPTLFIPEPGEWLHTFSWHASKGGSQGAEKIPNGLVFQKLWLMPDQMYHDVHGVRTSDDAVLTIRLMIFFELTNIERMLEATHDPIGDFVNATTADVVEFMGQHDFESFKRNTAKLNDLKTYGQLLNRSSQCGYRINNVVYRGYGAAQSLQQMHDQAIESRTKLQLDRATEQQAQELENYRLESQLTRASKRRSEQAEEVRHELDLSRAKFDVELELKERKQAFDREQKLAEAKAAAQIDRESKIAQQEHFESLKSMGVDLTAYLTQNRADKVIEIRGNHAHPHVHLEKDLKPDAHA